MASVLPCRRGWRPRFLQRVRCGVFAIALAGAGVPTAAASADPAWHTVGGAQVEGRLSQLIGSLAVIVGRDRTSFVSLDTLIDSELQRVADFLTAESAHQADWQNSSSKVARSLRGHLSVLHEGKLAAFVPPAATDEPAVYLVYFSAGWCPPCHRFTPELVKAYQRFQQLAPARVEVIFVSSDRGRAAQSEYVREMSMPWLVLDYSYLNQAPVIERWAGDGIPCLVALTRNGDAIFHTYRGTEYRGPEQVVTSCEQLLPLLNDRSSEVLRARHRLSVLQHLRAVGVGESTPKPYLVSLDPSRFGQIKTGPVTLTLSLDDHGKVTDANYDPSVPAVVGNLFAQAAGDWLFLPAVKQGKPVAATVRIPVRLDSGNSG